MRRAAFRGIGARRFSLARKVAPAAAAVLSVSAAGAGRMAAQEVHGVAKAGAAGESSLMPAPETSVVLVDAGGHVAAGAVTDSAGRFALRAPAAGIYRVRARRVGFTPDSSALLSLTPGQTVAFDPVLRAFGTQLTTVRIDAAQRCRIAPAAGALSHRLWQEAQSALTATAVASAEHRTGFVLRRFERELEGDGSTARVARTWDTRTLSSEPYASIAAESLAVRGFVVPVGDSLMYYAPDARTLLSDAFARGHCFRPTERGDHPLEIGLAFAPVTAGDATARCDVSGVLWLDRGTGRLVELEFAYGSATQDRRAPAFASGRVAYRRLPTGSWIVDHWIIRMPVVAMRTVVAPRGMSVVAEGTQLTRDSIATVAAVWEAGGEVISTYAPGEVAWTASAGSGRVSGRFVDTVQAAPSTEVRVRGVAGLHVMLTPRAGASSGARAYTARSDSSGAFTIDSIAPGAYTLRVSGSPLDTLDVTVPERDISVPPATSQSVLTVLPSQSAVLRHLCPSGLARTLGVVHGVVRDTAGGNPIARARVTVAWFDVADERQSHFVASAQTLSTVTDAKGAYVVCGVPRAHQLTVRASVGAQRTAWAVLEPSRPAARFAVLVLRGAAPPSR